MYTPEGVPLGGLIPSDVNNPKWVNLKPKINFIHYSDVEIFAEFIGEIAFEIRAKMVEISPESSLHGRLQDKRKRLSPENCFCVMAVLN